MINIASIIKQCFDKLPYDLKSCPWKATNHGRDVYTNEMQLDAYLAAYGEMHYVKCYAAIQNFPCKDMDDPINRYSYEIFDWGCGQGIATLVLLEFLHVRELLGRLKSITLIEPSTCALARAKRWVEGFVPGVKVKAVNKFIPNDNVDELHEVSCNSKISINLFSNILDIRDISLSYLADKTSLLADINYMICVGPKFTNNTRIMDFCGYFSPKSYFSNIESNRYAYTQESKHQYSCESKCFVHTRDEALTKNYTECAPVHDYTDDYDYAIECYKDIVDDAALKFYNRIKNDCGKTNNVFIRPNIGIDTVDMLVTGITRGIIIINICNDINDLENEIKRIKRVKDYIFNIHLKTIKVDSIINSHVYACVKLALYFPNSTKPEVDKKKKELQSKNSDKYQNEKQQANQPNDNFINDSYIENVDFKYLLELYESDDFKRTINNISSNVFKYDYYDELLKIIIGNWHFYKDGDLNFHLTPRQDEIVKSVSNRLRVKGVAGCGKTQLVANRAVEHHLKTGDKVLILTYNITLIRYIQMRIKQVPADFLTSMFEIVNYHQFFKSMANRYYRGAIYLADFDNPNFFEPFKNDIQRYKTIIIDEVQDFKSDWLSSIIKYFLKENGSISLFGDGEQNIYEREIEEETRMPVTPTFHGRWNEMNDRISMRIVNPNIATLSSNFAKQFIDNSSESLHTHKELMFEQYWIKYWNVGKDKTALNLCKNIRWIMQVYKLQPKDVVVLAESINILRDIEECYVVNSQDKTMTNFENTEQYRLCANKHEKSSTLLHKSLYDIRRVSKTHFTTACDHIKLSTIHSFKGWESPTVILIIQPIKSSESNYEGYCIEEKTEASPALLYTALTRAKCNLFVFNMGNDKYHSFFQKHINNG